MSGRKVVGIAGIAVVVLACILLLCPGPISGVWTGPIVRCLCDAHNFIVIDGNNVSVYFEDGTNSPPGRYSCEKVGWNSWLWIHTDVGPGTNSYNATIHTNSYLITPRLLSASVKNQTDSSRTWLIRDFRQTDAKRIRDMLPEPEKIGYFVARAESHMQPNE